MPPEAIASLRVTESLRTIAKFLDDGAKLASLVPPGQVLEPKLVEVPTLPGPRMTRLVWEDTNTREIEVEAGSTSDRDVVVTGENLADIALFKLVGAAAESTFFTTTEFVDVTKTGFTATIELQDPTPGYYHAHVLTNAGQTFLRRNALLIELADEGEEEEEPPPDPLQLGEIEPNEAGVDARFTGTLFLVRGTPADVSRVFVTDLNEVPQGWDVTIDTQLQGAAARRALRRRGGGLESVSVTIDVPEDAVLGEYLLVAQSDPLESEDRLVLHVVDLVPFADAPRPGTTPQPALQTQAPQQIESQQEPPESKASSAGTELQVNPDPGPRATPGSKAKPQSR